MTTTAEILQKARDLISDEKNWTQGAYARTKHGSQTQFERDDAVCFCSVGALFKVSGIKDCGAAFDVLAAESYESAGNVFPMTFNDTHTHAEVLDLFDRAIARAVASEGAA